MNVLREWVSGQRDSLTWLDSDRYSWAVFAGKPERWYDDPAGLVAATSQANRLVCSDIHGVKLVGPFSRHLSSASDAASVCDALQELEPRALLSDTLDAQFHQLGTRLDLVVECPSPRLLQPDGITFDFDDLDDVAAALLQVTRTIADQPVRGLQIICGTPGGPDEDEVESWSVLVAAARHYGWVTAVRLDGVADFDQVDPSIDCDLVLLPQLDPGGVPDDRRYGGGLPSSAWADSPRAHDAVADAARRQFRFGEIPSEASPEVVLGHLACLQESV